MCWQRCGYHYRKERNGETFKLAFARYNFHLLYPRPSIGFLIFHGRHVRRKINLNWKPWRYQSRDLSTIFPEEWWHFLRFVFIILMVVPRWVRRWLLKPMWRRRGTGSRWLWLIPKLQNGAVLFKYWFIFLTPVLQRFGGQCPAHAISQRQTFSSSYGLISHMRRLVMIVSLYHSFDQPRFLLPHSSSSYQWMWCHSMRITWPNQSNLCLDGHWLGQAWTTLSQAIYANIIRSWEQGDPPKYGKELCWFNWIVACMSPKSTW